MSHVCDGRDLTCLGCAGIARRHDLMRAKARTLPLLRTAMTLDDQLDDIKRARIWLQLEDKLAADAPRRSRWPLAIGVAAVASIAAIVLVVQSPQREPIAAAPPLLSVPVDTTVSSRLGPHTSAALVGPAQLEMIGAPGDATSVRLRRGTLLAEFAGGGGRSLRIETPRALVEVVGTLFAVEVRDDRTCTSVVHGKVRVTTPDGVHHVGAGERFCTNDEVRSIPTDVRDLLERHQAVITASVEPAKSVEPPSVVPPPVVPVPVIEPAPAPRPVKPAPVRVPAPAHADPPAREPALPVTALPQPPEPRVAAAPSTPRTEPVPQPAPQPTTPAKLTADELYRTAEAALAARDPNAADRALATLVTEHPASPLVDQALYERARIAHQQRSWAAARRHLDRLAAIPNTMLAEPGHYLACRIAVEARDAEATTCLADYRKAFPRSPHDLEALALLVQLAHARGGCKAALEWIDELVRAHPSARHATAWRARCPEAP